MRFAGTTFRLPATETGKDDSGTTYWLAATETKIMSRLPATCENLGVASPRLASPCPHREFADRFAPHADEPHPHRPRNVRTGLPRQHPTSSRLPMLKVLLVLLGLQLAPARAGAKHKQDRIDNSTFTDVFLSPSTPTLCGNSASTVTKAAQRVARGAVFASLASVTANLAGSAPTVLPLNHHELPAGFGAGSILSTTLVLRTAPMAPQSFPRGGGVSHKPPRRASGRPTRRDASETLASRTVAGGSSVW